MKMDDLMPVRSAPVPALAREAMETAARDRGRGDAGDPLELAAGLAALIGERDLDLVVAFATEEGLDALRSWGMTALVAAPAGVLAALEDQEAVCAAIAVLATIRTSDTLRRLLGPLEPAAMAKFGHLEHRGKHARQVLALIAADPDVRAEFERPKSEAGASAVSHPGELS